MNNIVIYIIKFYQNYISKYILVGKHCRFYPTCSEYSLLAFQKYGFFKASYLSIRRILRCNPFHEGGYDPLK
ncbi:MAG: membrane protein insertion efficiency factor YidD [Tissierellales bacterium]|nr:membrane protein insertion efficiency factor YidD [Tissierellales bacterium]